MFYPTNVYFREIKRIKPISKREADELTAVLCNGHTPEQKKQARVRLINGNQRFVKYIAAQYARGDIHRYLDLVQNGNIGLVKAVNEYGPHVKNAKRYFVASIRNAIIDECRKTQEYKNKKSDKPVYTDPLEKITAEETGDYTPAEDTNTLPPEAPAGDRDEYRKIRTIMSQLKPNEEAVIICRFGLAGSQFTLEELTAFLGYNHNSWISKMQKEAVIKLRRLCGSKTTEKPSHLHA
jgi:RNA polymerase sporulation-specific sigma factor